MKCNLTRGKIVSASEKMKKKKDKREKSCALIFDFICMYLCEDLLVYIYVK